MMPYSLAPSLPTRHKEALQSHMTSGNGREGHKMEDSIPAHDYDEIEIHDHDMYSDEEEGEEEEEEEEEETRHKWSAPTDHLGRIRRTFSADFLR